MNAPELFRGIRDADRHAGGIRCLRLFRVEETFFRALAGDVERLCAARSPSVVTREGHVTHWTRPFGDVLQYSLLNHTGRYDDFSADHELTCFGKRFHEPTAYPALHRFIEAFPHLVNFRVNVLGPGAGLSPHEEHVLVTLRSGEPALRLRFHLPVATDTGAELVLDGHVHHLESAAIYFVNHGCVHAARNRGERPRTHLVWDMLMTAEAYAVMFGDAEPAIPLKRVPAEEPAPLRIERMAAHRAVPRRAEWGTELPPLCEPQ